MSGSTVGITTCRWCGKPATAVATFQTDYDDEVEFAARRWLIDRGRDAAAGEGGPFCLVASFMHPHDPYVAKPEFWDLYDDDEIGIARLAGGD